MFNFDKYGFKSDLMKTASLSEEISAPAAEVQDLVEDTPEEIPEVQDLVEEAQVEELTEEAQVEDLVEEAPAAKVQDPVEEVHKAPAPVAASKKTRNVQEIPAVLPKGWYLPAALLLALDAVLGNADLEKTAKMAGEALQATKKNGPENHDVAFASLADGVENGKVTSKGYEFLGELYGLYAEML